MNSNEKILVTGSSGFIGMHLSKRLLDQKFQVYGIDNLNDYYDVSLKEKRLEILSKYKKFKFFKEDISDLDSMKKIFSEVKPDRVVNLAAQAGVQYSLRNPHAYIQSNIKGFLNILECCRYEKVQGLIYASSSSVYGSSRKYPCSTKDRVDSPISIYAATKKSNELMANSYSHLYNLRSTGLRFFTVYGEWGRPDMSMYIFLNKIFSGEEVIIFNHGDLYRDFTYIDDIINGIISSLEKNFKCEIFNLGNNKPEHIMQVLKIMENELKIKIKINFKGMQKGDVKTSFADIEDSIGKLGFKPKQTIYEGIPKFIKWYKEYHGVT